MREEAPTSKKGAQNDFPPCIAIGSERSKFEQFKASSDYLREPLATELCNDSRHFTNDAGQLLKFHGSYQQDNRENRKKGEDKDWQMMLRLRCPGGRVSPSLFCALNELSEKLGNGTLRATTRQAFQMHGVRKENLQTVIRTIVTSMGSTLAACGDISRNVMAPAAPFAKGGYPEARQLANDIADLLSPKKAEEAYLELWANGNLSYKINPSKSVLRAQSRQKQSKVFSGDSSEPLYGSTYLPRKFKCGVTVPGDNSIDLLTQDIGLVVFTNKKGVLEGCNVYVGGGMGRSHNNDQTFARVADPLGYVEAENILELVQSILAVQRDYGDRKIRRHARMKYLLQEQGINWFKNELQKNYFKYKISPMRKEPTMQLKDYQGWHKQDKKLWFIGIPILSGRLKGKLKSGLAHIVNKYQLEVRVTPNQDLLICNIGTNQRSTIKQEISKLGIEIQDSNSKLNKHAIACPALPLCGLALTEAERYLPQVTDRIEKLMNKNKINRGVLIRMTGCPNGCARPYMAEIGLVGSGIDMYQLWLGGTPNLQHLAKPYIQKMPLENLEKVLEPLLTSWEKNTRKMSLGSYIRKIGDQSVTELLSIGLDNP